MFQKSVVFALVGGLFASIGIAQTPDRQVEKDSPLSKSFAFAFDGSGGYLGVQTREVTRENFGKFGLREVRGVAVEKVVDGSPAAAAGLKDGDVIVRFNGDEITSGRKLSRLVSEVSPDHQVRLTILRGGSEQEVTATIGRSPGPGFFDNGSFKFSFPEGAEKMDLSKLKNFEQFRDLPKFENFKMPDMEKFKTEGFFKSWNMPDGETFSWNSRSGKQIGVSVYSLTKQLSDRYGVRGGVMINTVRENSAASKAGLRAGDVIVDVDGKPVTNELELIKSLNEKKEGSVTITVLRDGSRQTVNVTPEPAKDGGFFFRSSRE